MPEFNVLMVFVLATLALVVVPGPNIIYIVTRSVSQGRRVGVASALGVESGTLVHIAAATFGLSALVASSATALAALKYVGAAYLIYLGVRSLLDDSEMQFESAGGEARLSRVYLQGALVNVLNPKVALFVLAFLPQFVDPQRGNVAGQMLVLGLIVLVFGVANDLLYALAAGSLGAWLRQRPRFIRRQRYVTGGVYLALGAVAALSHVERGPKAQSR